MARCLESQARLGEWRPGQGTYPPTSATQVATLGADRAAKKKVEQTARKFDEMGRALPFSDGLADHTSHRSGGSTASSRISQHLANR